MDEDINLMEIIASGNENLIRTITASVVKVSSYKKSVFLLEEPSEDGYLVCNTLTGELVLLTPKEKDLLDNPSSFNSFRIIEELYDHALIVSSRCDEVKRTEQLRNILYRQGESIGCINHYNILPTTHCNARCFYCYESDVKHTSMTVDVANQLISFISSNRGKSDVVNLSWFGGEPTLGFRWIEYICNKLKELDIPFVSSMVSNGYLFDEEMVQIAKNTCNLTSVQITLDGPEKVYNKIKSFVSAKDNPYIRVLHNIDLLLDLGIRVDIRLNMDKHNVDDLSILVDDLEARFVRQKNILVYVRLLKEDVGFKPIEHSSEGIASLRKSYMSLRRRLEQDGWPQNRMDELPRLKAFHCMADNPGIVQVTPDGIIGKCEDAIYEHTIGDLKNGITDQLEITRWRQMACFEECSTCPLLPSCMHLLIHCPSRAKNCWEDEKEEMLNRIRLLMIDTYKNRKQLD